MHDEQPGTAEPIQSPGLEDRRWHVRAWRWIKAQAAFAWRHRTATIGSIGVAGGSAQSWFAQHDHVLSPKWHGILLGGLGALVFWIGVYNSILEYRRNQAQQ